jgi:WD40 repeat protein
MITGFRVHLLVSGLILASCLVGTVAGVSLGIDWEQNPVLTDNTFSGVTLTPNSSIIYSGGSQLLVRSWDSNFHWGGQSGFIAAMSADGGYVVTSTGSTVTLLNASGTQIWSRNMDGQIRAVAVAPNGTFVISADDRGNYNSWGPNGDFYARNKTDVVKRLAIAPTGNLVVATTERGILFFTPGLEPVWTDSRAGNLDEYIVISADGSTIITAGGPRLSSHTSKGVLNWQADVTNTAINDVACSEDCSLIVVGSQDNTVQGIDRYGKTHWTFPTGQWTNAVGVSRSGAVIAAGSNDGTLFILDHGGRLLTKRLLDGRIQIRSVAVSRDGTRVVAADQYKLYGMSLIGMSPADAGSDTIFVAATLNPAPKTTTPVTPATTAPEVTAIVRESPAPLPVTTKQSPVVPWAIATALAGALYLVRHQGR